MTTTAHWKICAVCGYPLERSTDPTQFDGSEWGHIRFDVDDHVVVPVDVGEIEYNQRCDFCDREDATHVVLSTSFVVPGTNSRSIGGWAACETCADLAGRKRWSQLITYVTNNGGPMARQVSRKALRVLYEDGLGLHMYGVVTMAEWKTRHSFPRPGE